MLRAPTSLKLRALASNDLTVAWAVEPLAATLHASEIKGKMERILEFLTRW